MFWDEDWNVYRWVSNTTKARFDAERVYALVETPKKRKRRKAER